MSRHFKPLEAQHLEKNRSLDQSNDEREGLKLDRHGLPLRPQPSGDPLGVFEMLSSTQNTDLTRPTQLESMAQGICTSSSVRAGFLGTIHASNDCEAAGLVHKNVQLRYGHQNPAYVPSAKALHISIQDASYQTTVPILFAGLAPLVWSPLSNIYGRRPIFIFVTALGIATLAAAAAAPRFSEILAARAFMGIGTSAGMGIGATAVADMYFMHERGRQVFVLYDSFSLANSRRYSGIYVLL